MAALSGLSEFLKQSLIFESDPNDEVSSGSTAKTVKLRFTVKQYVSFRDACNLFELLAKHPEFNDFVVKVINSDVIIRPNTIQKQLVEPILSAPTKVMVKTQRKSTGTSYFTNPVPVTKEAKRLYDTVKNNIDKDSLKVNFESEKTCVTDIKLFVNKYIQINQLDSSNGIVLTKALVSFSPNTFKANNNDLIVQGGKSYIPKENKMKIISAMTSDILFKK